MSQPDNNDELEEAMRRMGREFGPRRPREGELDEPPPRPPAPPPSLQGPGGPAMPRMMPPPRPPARPRTPAALALLWAIVIIYVLSSAISGGLFQPSMAALVLLGAKVNDLIQQGQYWRLLTAAFLHANLIHIFFNGYALYALGPEAERIYGTRRFLALYLVAGLTGSLASYLMSPAVSVGASGAIFGLIGGLGMFYYLNRSALGEFGRAQVQSMVAIAMINLFIGFAAQGVIDNWGHMGGLIGGALAGLALAPRLRVDGQFYPPLLRRSYPELGLAGVLALLLVIAAMVLLLPPA